MRDKRSIRSATWRMHCAHIWWWQGYQRVLPKKTWITGWSLKQQQYYTYNYSKNLHHLRTINIRQSKQRQNGSYLSSQCVDNSSVAEHHRHRRQQVSETEEGRWDAFLCSMAAERIPRYTGSIDDVATHTGDYYHVRRYQDPDNQDCRIHQALLGLELQNVNHLAFRQSIRQHSYSLRLEMIDDDDDDEAIITVRHGSADTVVRAMNDFNGKCYFSGSDSSETFWQIFKKFCTVDYVGEPTPHANVGVNRFKGGVSAHTWSCRRQASIFFFF